MKADCSPTPSITLNCCRLQSTNGDSMLLAAGLPRDPVAMVMVMVPQRYLLCHGRRRRRMTRAGGEVAFIVPRHDDVTRTSLHCTHACASV